MGALINDSEINQLRIDRKDMGQADTLRYNVIIYVVEENYEKAIHELRSFLERDSEYPKFRPRIERYINYAIDLVNAIRAKRRFPGVHSLTMAKQKEIVDRFHAHFKELKIILMRIEKVQQDLKNEDVRSTALVVRTSVNAAFAIAILAFVLEGIHGLMANLYIVADDYIGAIADFIFHRIF
jgi:hypothetical protein